MANQLTTYVQQMAATNPQEAVQIALAEAERERSLAAQAQAEYRALSEVEFDDKGKIVKANLAGLYRLAAAYSKSRIVPEHYQSKYKPSGELIQDATPDCFIACQMALRLGIDPLAYMQASYIVHGKPGIEAKLATALLNTSGKIKGRLRYKFEREKGKAVACTATALDAETGDEVSATVTWEMAVAEGWTTKTGSKWKTMPDVMFQYRAATILIRLYYSEVLMGIATVEELDDLPVSTPQATTLAELSERIEGPTATAISNGNGHAEPDDAGTAHDETSQLDPSGDLDEALLDEARAAFDACTEGKEISKAQEIYRTKAQTEAERTAVNGLADDARARLKPQKQKELAGA